MKKVIVTPALTKMEAEKFLRVGGMGGLKFWEAKAATNCGGRPGLFLRPTTPIAASLNWFDGGAGG